MGLFGIQCTFTFILGVMRWLLILGGNEDSFLWNPVDTGFWWAVLSWLITLGYVYRGEKNDFYEVAYRQEKERAEKRSLSDAHEIWDLESKVRVMKEERDTFLELTEKVRATLEMKLLEPKVISVEQEVFSREQEVISNFV